MCGINGVLGSDFNSIGKANFAISHRGPDYSSIYVDDHISLGHTLLSIRGDVEDSVQPKYEKNSAWILLFNGQIYNTNQIRDSYLSESEHRGSNLDTFLLYQLIQKYGWNFIKYIHGMYVIALYNREEKKLVLYRDPAGQKNLYYYRKDNFFAFSSEIKGLLSHNIDVEVDYSAVSIAISLGYIPGTKTLMKNIKKLGISQMLTLDLISGECSCSNFVTTGREYYKGLSPDAVFQKNIEEHLQGRHQVAINLSGGIDSSLIYLEACHLGYKLKSYSTRFDVFEPGYNEDAVLAKQLTADFGTEHNEIYIDKKQYLDNFEEAYALVEEPNYNISLPIYLATAKVEGRNGDGNRIILSGDGGDEVFGGYGYYNANLRYDALDIPFFRYFFQIIKNRNKVYNYNYSSIVQRWLSFKNIQIPHVLQDALDTRSVVAELEEIYDKYAEHYSIKNSSLYKMMLVDRCNWLGNECFIRSDKLFMSQSVEVRNPFAFQPFRTYCDEIIEKDEYLNGFKNKLFVRELYKDKLPKYILEMSKRGWRAPIQLWYDKMIKERFMDILGSVQTNQSIIDWKKIRLMVEKSNTYPGKYIHLYLSMAILSRRFSIEI